MKRKRFALANIISTITLLISLFLIGSTTSQPAYNPWADINDDGFVNAKDAIVLGSAFGSSGTPITKAALEYDSGWLDITDKCGQYFNVVHNFNSTEIMVDITGKIAVGGGIHQRNLGGTGLILGWTQTYGGATHDYAGYSVISTEDGGYAIAGSTQSFGAGSSDIMLVKTDALGNHLWNQTYGGINNDGARRVIQTNDGGYAIIGYTTSFGAGVFDFWLVKTDSNGNHLWNQTYGGIGNDLGYSIVQTSDGEYAILGRTYSFGAGGYDIWLIRTDALGNHQWNQTYGGTFSDYGSSVVLTADGGYAITGSTLSFGSGNFDIWLIKTDKQGNHMWNQTYGGTDDDEGFKLVQLVDSYVIAGYTKSFGAGDSDFWLIRTDRFGDHMWNQTYGGIDEDEAYSVEQTNDGGYAITGYTRSFGAGQSDVWFVKTDASGNHQWNQTYGGTYSDHGWSAVQTNDGGYVLMGETDSFGAGGFDLWLVQVNTESGLAWTDSTENTVTLYRGATDSYWNFVRVRIWKIKESP